MNTRYLITSLALIGANSLIAAGVDWSYSGQVPYQAALVVWTDPGKDPIRTKEDIELMRSNILSELGKPTDTTLSALTKLCRSPSTAGSILVDVIQDFSKPTRVNHEFIYLAERTGWGFSLMLKFDSAGRVTEYAVNDVTKAVIVSEAVEQTSLVITDEMLTTVGTAAAALARLKAAPAPVIVAHEASARMIAEPSADKETFVFDVTNAVGGYTYHVISTTDLSLPFTRLNADRFAASDGKLEFELPIDKSEKVRFYRVSVGE